MTPPAPDGLDLGDARRIALAAQGFDVPRPRGRVDVRHVRRALGSVAVLQLDSVNVFCRSHYMPVYSRVGPYPREILDALAGHETSPASSGRRSPTERELFEYWAHQASLISLDLQPLLRWRMARADQEAWKFVVKVAKEQPQLVENVLALVAERGPIRGADASPEPRTRDGNAMWDWSDGKNALEYLFYAGRVCASQRVNFERLYDLPERVLPPDVLAAPTPAEDDAQRQLILIAARALGVASEEDLGDYFRLARKASKERVAELVQAGTLETTAVEGWRMPAYTLPGLPPPRPISARALLSPFDSLIWSRARTSRLFGFDYRIEIYTPAAKRQFGYYVLPFLLGESLVARVDLKADRKAGVLRVLGAFAEDGHEPGPIARELASELLSLANWLGLRDVAAERRGNLAPRLATELAATKQ
jgi:uncharacterized protein